jgi:opacity protein-like surface antigen
LRAACLAAAALCLLSAASASAQIRSPRSHNHYGVELEPHLVVQWADEPFWNDTGIGVGLRASIPVLQDGPISTINNSLAVGFGLDWAHFDDCGNFNNLCDANDFWIPIVVQWNFFLTKSISMFGEFGLAIQHSTLNWSGPIPGNCARVNGVNICTDSVDHTDVELVLWLGARFALSDNIAFTLRLGTPSLLFGLSIFL